MESRHVTVSGGLPIRWEESGIGFPVVFVHGIPTSPALWRHVVGHVKGARCLTLELVGYGSSLGTGQHRDISVTRQADYLLAWLDAIGVERAVLAGHDVGGGVVQVAAARSPRRCAGLLLTNAVGYDAWPVPAVKALQRAAGAVARLPPGAMPPAFAPLMLRGHDDWGTALAALRLHGRAYARPGGPAALARQARALDVRDTLAVQQELPRLGVPARVVWGTADRFLKPRYGERFAADLDAPLRRIHGGRHFTPEDHPGTLAAATNELVRIADSASYM